MDNKSENKSGVGGFLGTAAIMGVIVILSKVLGLLRDVLVADAYGTGLEAVAYDTASRLPVLLFDFVIGGVVSAAFIPVFNELLVKKGKDDAMRFSVSYVNLILLITTTLSVIGVVFADVLVGFLAPEISAEAKSMATDLTRIMFPMIIFTGLAFSFVGILQSMGEFKIPALISLLSNAIMVIYLFTLNNIFGIVGLAVSMLLGWASQAIVQMPKLHSFGWKYSFRSDFRSPYIKKALKNAVPILLGTWTQPVCSLINTRFASGLNEGRAITALGYANRLYTIIAGVFTFICTNLLFPYFSRASASGNKEEGRRMMTTSIKILVFIIAPITAGIIILSTPITALIYERGEFTSSDTALTATALSRYAIGMIFLAANEVIVKAFFADGNTKIPMISSIVSMIVNIALVSVFADKLGVGGIALASGIAMILNFAINSIVMRKKDGHLFGFGDILDFMRSIIAAAVMGTAIFFLKGYFASPIAAVSVCVPTGMAVYFIISIILRSEETSFILKHFTKKNDHER
ncbi:MAG: murein biosynthesis integral membrane protein MurJ [Ruminococcaceae bacterium]|nr:murein biosynthesis integral membrane protein MurJ [Oscillospiraceae bacterium]